MCSSKKIKNNNEWLDMNMKHFFFCTWHFETIELIRMTKREKKKKIFCALVCLDSLLIMEKKYGIVLCYEYMHANQWCCLKLIQKSINCIEQCRIPLSSDNKNKIIHFLVISNVHVWLLFYFSILLPKKKNPNFLINVYLASGHTFNLWHMKQTENEFITDTCYQCHSVAVGTQ